MIFSRNIFNSAVITVIVLFCFSGCVPSTKPPAVLQIPDSSPARGEKISVAVLPAANLSRTRAPLADMKKMLTKSLQKMGFHTLDNKVLERFMAKYRIRYVGGLDKKTIEAIREDTGVQAVFLTSLEHYDTSYPPKISITCRLVSTEGEPEILWAESIGLAGDDSPELLGLGLIKDPRVLLNNAFKDISDSLADYLSGVKKEPPLPPPPLPEKRIIPEKRTVPEKRTIPEGSQIVEYPETFLSDDISYIPFEAPGKEKRRFDPKTFFRSSIILDRDLKYSVAVLPFFNKSEKKYAGEIMANHFMSELEQLENIDIIEPGAVRESMLKFRVVMQDGISLDHATVLFSRLNADLMITGTVLDYEDYQGPYGRPVVDFSIMVIERKSKKVIWASKSSNEGDDDVFFFDIGKINTANVMAAEMVRTVVNRMFQ